MINTKMNTIKIILKNTLLVSFAMLIYFFFLRGFDLDKKPLLRLVNLLFILFGINNTIKDNIFYNNEYRYLKNLSIGFSTSLLAVIISLFYLIIYVNFVHPNFISVLQNSFFLWKNNLSFTSIIFILFIQGTSFSLICSFLIMKYWKNYSNKII